MVGKSNNNCCSSTIYMHVEFVYTLGWREGRDGESYQLLYKFVRMKGGRWKSLLCFSVSYNSLWSFTATDQALRMKQGVKLWKVRFLLSFCIKATTPMKMMMILWQLWLYRLYVFVSQNNNIISIRHLYDSGQI